MNQVEERSMDESARSAREIFVEAVEFSSQVDRESLVRRLCGDNTELRAEVETLLFSHDQLGDFLDDPAGAIGLLVPPDPSDPLGKVIDSYRLIEEIGEGGFGVVFLAEQTVLADQSEPRSRRVALKVIKPGMDSREVIARFAKERAALASMNHPNIAMFLGDGTTQSGRVYFVMEFVDGVPLTQYCDEHRLDTSERLLLFSKVCKAIRHAHQKGIVHRDIKPSNILVTVHDEEPSPKIIDFGISKAISQRSAEKTTFTQYGQIIGTPQYMSPEQASVEGMEIDERSDVYSLGVLLYELLTGTTPVQIEAIRSAAYDELCRLIREGDVPPPSTRLSSLGSATASAAALRRTNPKRLRGIVRGELDWIVMKALEKERDRRYDSSADFAADIEAYLNNETVTARPPSNLYRIRKFVQQKWNRRLVEKVIVFLGLLTVCGFMMRSLWPSDNGRRQIDPQEGLGPPEPESSWSIPPKDTAFSPQHAWLDSCKLVLLAETGTKINLDDAEDFVRSRSQSLFLPNMLTFNASRRAEVVRTIQLEEGWLLWEMPLSIIWSDKPNELDGHVAKRDSGLGPKEVSIKLRIAVGRNGAFQLGTYGDSLQEHLLVLAQHQGIPNYRYFGNGYLKLEQYGTPHDFALDLDDRQNSLAYWFSNVFVKFHENALVSDGPQHFGDLYQCPLTVRNHFDMPIVVLQGLIHHQQFDYEGYSALEVPVNEAANTRWSPIADAPDQDVEITLDVELMIQDENQSVLCMETSGDRNNATAFLASGVDFVAEDYYHFNGDPQESETSLVAIDLERGICAGSHKNVAGATVILYDQSPTQIELQATSTWSVVRPHFRYVKLGDAPLLNATLSAVVTEADGARRQVSQANVQLHNWTLPPFGSTAYAGWGAVGICRDGCGFWFASGNYPTAGAAEQAVEAHFEKEQHDCRLLDTTDDKFIVVVDAEGEQGIGWETGNDKQATMNKAMEHYSGRFKRKAHQIHTYNNETGKVENAVIDVLP